MKKLLINDEDHKIMVLSKNEHSILQTALIDRQSKLNNLHADLSAVLSSDTLSEDEFNLKNHQQVMIEDEMNVLKEMIFYKQ